MPPEDCLQFSPILARYIGEMRRLGESHSPSGLLAAIVPELITRSLQTCSSRWLAGKEKSLWIWSLPAHLEGSKIFVPFPVRDFGIGLNPEAELVQVRDRDAPIGHPLYEMLPDLCREVCPEFELGHLSTEDHLPEFLPEPFGFLRIISSSKAFGELKKCLLLLLS
jgi:hypothetical protein